MALNDFNDFAEGGPELGGCLEGAAVSHIKEGRLAVSELWATALGHGPAAEAVAESDDHDGGRVFPCR